MVTNEFIGSRIRAARKESGLTQHQLGRELELSQSGVSMIETGNRPLTIDQLASLSQFFGKPPSYFLEESRAQVHNHRITPLLEEMSKYPDLVRDFLRYVEFVQFRRQVSAKVTHST